MVISILIAIFVLIGGIALKKDSDKIWGELNEFERSAMHGAKKDIPLLKNQVLNYENAWHRFHTAKLYKILSIIEARQRWEKE